MIPGLSEGGRRALSFILKGLEEGLSGKKIIELLREHGLGYRLSDFYNDLRILKGEMKRWDTMKYVPKDKVISEKLYTPTEKMGKNKFITVFKLDVVDLLTGEKRIEHVSVGHDFPMRRKDLEEMAIKAITGKPERYDLSPLVEVIKIMPVKGFVRI